MGIAYQRLWLRDQGKSVKDAMADRPKFVGFVGILTGFLKADRREALWNTWFLSDPEVGVNYWSSI